jgi:ethanolamine ammonia-lyase small subunit
LLHAESQAPDRHSYLLRPDLGRKLSARSKTRLAQEKPAPELAIVIADGLSALAVQHHALPLLQAFQREFGSNWAETPVVIALQGRVALGDDIGETLSAKMVAVLIGERPGLSSPDSLGVYLTYAPQAGRMDSERNCISNIRPQGLGFAEAAQKMAWLCREALQRKVTGIALKDESGIREIKPPLSEL